MRFDSFPIVGIAFYSQSTQRPKICDPLFALSPCVRARSPTVRTGDGTGIFRMNLESTYATMMHSTAYATHAISSETTWPMTQTENSRQGTHHAMMPMAVRESRRLPSLEKAGTLMLIFCK